MNIPLANYEEEQALFQNLLKAESGQRILMFYGESGSGKSSLLRRCITQIPMNVRHLSVQLRGSDTSAAHIYGRFGRRIGWERLSRFLQQAATLAGDPDAHKDVDWRLNISGHLQQALQVKSVTERKQRRQQLTDAWFADARTFQSPFLLVLDTYEKATTELDDWFINQFLPWTADIQNVRVVIAGQQVPEMSADWSHCCRKHELRGVPEARAWLPVAEAMGREVPSLDYLAGACAAYHGNPSDILQFVEMLPRVQDQPVAPQLSQRVDRVRLRQYLVEYFDNTELQEICFDLNLDYQAIVPAESNKRAQVLALITHMESHGRLSELAQHCQTLRPKLEW